MSITAEDVLHAIAKVVEDNRQLQDQIQLRDNAIVNLHKSINYLVTYANALTDLLNEDIAQRAIQLPEQPRLPIVNKTDFNASALTIESDLAKYAEPVVHRYNAMKSSLNKALTADLPSAIQSGLSEDLRVRSAPTTVMLPSEKPKFSI